MAIEMSILNKLWNETADSTWSSLLDGFDEIHAKDIITTEQWQDLEYAIKQAKEDEADFPDSIGELYVAFDPYISDLQIYSSDLLPGIFV